jgi:histidine triad (HIT) family protein
MKKDDCIFCKIIKGEIPSYKIYEDEKTYAFLDINPMHPGHTLLLPKEHQEYIFDVDDPLYSELFKTAKKLSVKLKEVTQAKKIGLAIEGISVDHVHLHLVPVNNVNDLDPCLAKKADPKVLEDLAKKLRSM